VSLGAGQVEVSLAGCLYFFVNVPCRLLLLLAAISQNSSKVKNFCYYMAQNSQKTKLLIDYSTKWDRGKLPLQLIVSPKFC
jgi:hypothetical protein